MTDFIITNPWSCITAAFFLGAFVCYGALLIYQYILWGPQDW